MTLGELKCRADALAAAHPHLKRAVSTKAAQMAQEGRSKHDLLDAVIVLAACYSGSMDFDMADRLVELERL